MRRATAAVLLLVAAGCAGPIRLDAPPPPAATAADAFAAAKADGKPVLLLARDEDDVGTLDAARWLSDPALARDLAHVHACAPWSWRARPRAAESGRVALFAPDGRLIASPPVPQRREDMATLIEDALRDARPLDELARDPYAGALAARRLVDAGRADEVPPAQAAAVSLDPAELAALARLHWSERLGGAAELLRACARAVAELAPKRRELARLQAYALELELGQRRDATNDAAAREALDAALIATWPRDAEADLVAAVAHGAIELGGADLRRRAAQAIDGRVARGRDAADAFMDLADAALGDGQPAEADQYWRRAQAAADGGASAAYAMLAPAMRALAGGDRSPANDAFLRRRALDVVVLVRDLPSFARAVARWDAQTFFPVLFDDADTAPRFIAAWKPARVVRLPPAAGPDALDLDSARGAAWSAWTGEDAVAPLDERVLRARWSERDPARASLPAGAPDGIVVSDGGDCLAGALALAAGRFEPLVGLASPTVGAPGEERPGAVGDYVQRPAAEGFARAVRERLAAWGAWRDDRWTAVALCGAYPFRWIGAPTAYGTTYCLDDLVGRDDETIRHAVCGRLQGPRARAAYEAMCALFLRPEDALLFNTYGGAPATPFGSYTLDPAETAWGRLMRITSIHADQADVRAFRRATHPVNRFGAVIINSSGGAYDWSVTGGGGTADDFWVGAPCVVHVTHSGSAAEPYDPDTLAGRAIWGGAYSYFGSTAEPFLQAFQPSRYFAPRIAVGAPYAFAFRKRAGQYAARPWRLISFGDPLAALRAAGVARAPAPTPLLEGEQEVPVAEAAAAPTPAPDSFAGRVAAREAAAARADAALQAKDLAALLAALVDLLKTGPAANFTARWLDDAVALARGDESLPRVLGWLQARVEEPRAAPLRDAIGSRLATVGLEVALTQPTWDAAARREVLDGAAALVTAQDQPRALAERIDPVVRAWCERVDGATPATFVFALAPSLDADRLERLRAAFVELDKQRGLSRAFALIGPFPGAPDAAIDAQVLADGALAGVARGPQRSDWKRPFAAGDSGPIDLVALMDPHVDCCAYAASDLVAERDLDAWLLIGSDDGVAAWLDGKGIWDNPTMRGLTPDEDHVRLRCGPGTHRLVLRIAQGGGGWGFSVRLAADEAGAPLAGAHLSIPR